MTVNAAVRAAWAEAYAAAAALFDTIDAADDLRVETCALPAPGSPSKSATGSKPPSTHSRAGRAGEAATPQPPSPLSDDAPPAAKRRTASLRAAELRRDEAAAAAAAMEDADGTDENSATQEEAHDALGSQSPPPAPASPPPQMGNMLAFRHRRLARPASRRGSTRADSSLSDGLQASGVSTEGDPTALLPAGQGSASTLAAQPSSARSDAAAPARRIFGSEGSALPLPGAWTGLPTALPTSAARRRKASETRRHGYGVLAASSTAASPAWAAARKSGASADTHSDSVVTPSTSSDMRSVAGQPRAKRRPGDAKVPTASPSLSSDTVIAMNALFAEVDQTTMLEEKERRWDYAPLPLSPQTQLASLRRRHYKEAARYDDYADAMWAAGERPREFEDFLRLELQHVVVGSSGSA